MTSRANRRRAKASATTTTKQAFEENENEVKSNNEEALDQSKPSPKISPKPDRLYEKAFFSLNNLTVEVVLEHNMLSWSTILGEAPSADKSEDATAVIKLDANLIDLHQVYAISPINSQSNWTSNNGEDAKTMTVSSASAVETQLRGFQLHTYEKKTENILQEILIIFQSISPDLIQHWYRLLSKQITEYKPVRNVLVICNPFSGLRSSRQVYNAQIRPLLERARYNITYFEINDNQSADDVLKEFHGDYELIYGLVILGGDGSVINTINALLRSIAKENRTKLTTENELPPFPFPISIVPTGTTNIIAHSIYGNNDICTPIIHLLFNQRMKIDMSAIFDSSTNFVTANFSAGAGYPANALKYFRRYSFLNSKKIIRKSFVKATSNKNLWPIEVEIRYIPADQNITTTTRCYQGCPLCTPPVVEQTDNQVQAFDNTHLEKINRGKKPPPSSNGHRQRPSSSKKSSKRQSETDQTWTALRNNYLQVLVLTNATLWSFAPQGLSKLSHMADGLLDLILIAPTSKKDFVRYLKRNGNSKNQYELPFTSIIKVKEIEIELKLPHSDLINDMATMNNQVDSSLSDDQSDDEQLNDENKASAKQNYEPRPPSGQMSEDSRRRRRRHHHQQSIEQTEQSSKTTDPTTVEDQSNSTSAGRRGSIFRSFKSKKEKIPLPRPSSACDSARPDEKQDRKRRPSTSIGKLRPGRSLLNFLETGNLSSEKQDSASTTMNNSNGRRASIMSRASSMENVKTSVPVDNQHRNNKEPCVWNLDFTPYNSPLIRMKCFYRFLPVFGVGLSPDTILKELPYSCF